MVINKRKRGSVAIMNRLMLFLNVAILMLVGLGACTTAESLSAPVNLPLADDQPTFLFFYTDN
jgi:hypothetical protein